MRPHRQQPTRLSRPWDSPGKNTGVCCHFLLQCMKVKSESEVAQSCLTLCDPMDFLLPGSSVHGIFQARVLEWGAIAFSNTYAVVYKYIFLFLLVMKNSDYYTPSIAIINQIFFKLFLVLMLFLSLKLHACMLSYLSHV